ncbi:MAG: cyclic peptide export ABC transporter [Polyangiales bacterium]
MRTLRFVLRSAGTASIAIGLIGLASAAANGGLIAIVHRALSASEQQRWLALAFVALGLGKVLCAYASGRLAESHSQQKVSELRRELTEKLLAVPYQRFEQLGSARAHAALTSDVLTVNAALQAASQAVVNAATLLGAAAYLAYLDTAACAVLLAVTAIGAIVYRMMSKRARASLGKARDELDRLYAQFAALTSGIKELKLHAGKRRAFLDGPLHAASEALRAHEQTGQARYLLGQAVNSVLVLGMIGLVLFGLPLPDAARSGLLSGYVLTGLYAMGPLAALLRLTPVYAAAEIALRRIEDLGVQLHVDTGEPSAPPDARPSFQSIDLRAVVHRYDERGEAFQLGPLSLQLRPGQVLFVTGGNGSGKSTLAKLMTGLYVPSAGELRWDDRVVGRSERDLYRQLFSAVFSDAHLFDRLHGVQGADLDSRANALATELGLAHVLRVEHGALSSIDLSSGQRKRAALLAALLDDRPIYLFDELAAEQDASFKQIFYRQLLPQLAQRGKAVVVITHDERFFDVADRVLKLVDGLAADAGPAAPATAGSP